MITWDEGKREKVIRDHGLDFGKIEDLFGDPFAINYEDNEHSDSEHRWVIIAKSAEYGLVVLVYTVVAEGIRCVTARRAERWMVRMYEDQRNRY